MENNRPVVAQIHEQFFIKSETFIYNPIMNFRHVEPICVAKSFTNLEMFPFPEEKRFLFQSAGENAALTLLRKVTDIDIQTEALLKRKDVRLLHAHFGPNGFMALPLKKRLRLPLITTFYGYDASELGRSEVWRDRYKKLFAEGDIFLAEGECMRSKLISLGCPENKVRIQPIAIPIHRIPFKARGPKTGGRIVFIFSGRFVEKKGMLYALEALKAVREKRSDFELNIIGDGPLRPEIEAFIKTHSMENYVRFLGFLDYQNYLVAMAHADIFVQPSVTAANGDDEGGAPTTILEAQAMGMPILATRHADIPNIVVPDKSALLSDEKDVAGLSRNIEWLLNNQNAWGVMGTAGRKFVEGRHDLGVNVEKLEKLYLSLIAPSSA